MKLKGLEGHRIASYDLADPEDFAHYVQTGVVWDAGGQEEQQQAVNLIVAGTIPIADCENMPPDVRAFILLDDESNPDEPAMSDPRLEEPIDNTNEPTPTPPHVRSAASSVLDEMFAELSEPRTVEEGKGARGGHGQRR